MYSIEDAVSDLADPSHPWHGDYMRALYQWALEEQAELIYEVGIFMARSTYPFLIALSQRGGRLFSCDINPDTRRSMSREELLPHWTCCITDSITFGHMLIDLADIVYLDGGHTYYTVSHELPLFWHLLKPGGLLIAHDTDLESERRAIEDWLPVEAAIEYVGIGPGFARIRKEG